MLRKVCGMSQLETIERDKDKGEEGERRKELDTRERGRVDKYSRRVGQLSPVHVVSLLTEMAREQAKVREW